MRKIAAAIIEQDGRIFIARRAKDDPLQGLWEFPGGKLEEGETLEECLKRELFEELGIDAAIGKYFSSTTFTHKETVWELVFFKVTSYTGTITLYDHSEMAWVRPEELTSYRFPAPDEPIIELLLNEVSVKNS